MSLSDFKPLSNDWLEVQSTRWLGKLFHKGTVLTKKDDKWERVEHAGWYKGMEWLCCSWGDWWGVKKEEGIMENP